VTEHS